MLTTVYLITKSRKHGEILPGRCVKVHPNSKVGSYIGFKYSINHRVWYGWA